MKITNGTPFLVEQIHVDVLFQDENGFYIWATSDPNDTGAWFFIRPEGGGAAMSQDGQSWMLPDIPAYTEAPPAEAPSVEARWLIIPAPGAGGTDPRGALYPVGAFIRYTQGGEENTIDVAPDTIRVMPMPILALDYFLPIDVLGDDPATTLIEPVVPFPLGLRIRNVGAGIARNVRIDSGQPKIVENYQGLLLNFAITGSSVNGEPATPSLLVNFGDLAPDATATAAWQMTCSLTGRFVSFGAKISHADELGGQVTSLIPEENLRTFALVKDVFTPGDAVPDFLACERGPDGTPYLWTLAVYTSDGLESPVYDQSWGAALTLNEDGSYSLVKSEYDQDPGYVYIQLDDPFAGASPLREVVRSDGAVLVPQNAWLSRTKVGDTWRYTVNLFDVDTAGKTYLVRFQDGGTPGNRAPVLEAIADWTVRAGSMLGFVVHASDPDGTTPLVYTGSLPYGASFHDEGNGTGRFEWTPSAGQLGTYSVQFVASDGDLTAERTATITVVDASYNRPPTVQDLAFTTDEDTLLAAKLTGTDPENDPLTFSVVKQPDHGALTSFNPATGDFTYTPAADFHGADTFTFGASDGRASSGLAAVHLTVDPVNDAPTSASASITTKQDQPSDPVSPQVTDPDGDTVFTITVETQPAHGTAEVVNNQLVYTPSAGYFGADSFTFRAADAGGLPVTGTAAVTVVETPFDLAVYGVTLNGTVLEARVASTRTVPVTGVGVELRSRTAAGDTPLTTVLADLQPGENIVSLDLGAPPAPGTALSVEVDPAGALGEADRFNNTAGLGTGLPVVVTAARPPAFAPGADAVLSGRAFYRLSDNGTIATLPVQGGAVHVTLTRDGESQPAVASDARTDRNGAWHAALTLPAEAGVYRLAVRAGDSAAEELLERTVPVDPVLVTPPPYPGPGGDPTVSIDDPAALEAWMVEPGTPVPTTGEGGSGVRGGRTGTGDSTSLVPGGPALGSRGGAASVFDAQVVPGSLTLSNPAPNAGERVQLEGVIRANDSYYGLPVLWRVTDPAGHTTPLAPATWYYVDGDLHVFGAFTPPAVGTYVVRLSLAPGFADADAGNDEAAANLTATRPNHAPEIQGATLPEHAWTGESVTFAVQATDEDGDPLTYAWNFGDGGAAGGPDGEATHVFATAGPWPVSVEVTDGQGGSASRSVTITVEDRPNRAPVIESVTIPTTAAAGDMVSFGVSASDPDGDALSASWDFGDGASAQGMSAVHTFGAAGSFTVTVTVDDGRGGQAQASGLILVTPPPNRAPVISGTTIPSPVNLAEIVNFSVQASDPDGDPLTCVWNFGDGGTASGLAASHAYAVDGDFTVTVVVTDGRGGSAAASGAVHVVNPEADVTVLALGESLGGLSGAGGSQAFYKVLTPAGVTALHVATSGGTGNVQLYVKEGAKPGRTAGTYDYRSATPGNAETVNVTTSPGGKTWYLLLYGGSAYAGVTLSVTADGVYNRPPVITSVQVPRRARVNEPVTFGVEASDPDGDSLTAEWTFGDGASASGVTPSHVYAAVGAYPVTVMVSDGRGGAATASGAVTVKAAGPNQPPVISDLNLSSPATLGGSAGMSATVLDPDGDPLDLLWDFGDGRSGEGTSVTHRYTLDGAYRVSVMAFDGWGGVTTAKGDLDVVDPETDAPALALGESRDDLGGAGGSQAFFKVLVPEDVTALTLSTAGGTGNVQLYVKEGSRPGRTNGTYDVRSATPGNAESVTLSSPGGKTWYVLLYGGSAYAGVTLTVAGTGADRPPELTAGTLSAHLLPGQETTFGITGSDPDGDTLRAWWDFGDGRGAEGLAAAYAYPEAGSYPVTVMVGDGRGGIVTAEGSAAVSLDGGNAPPVIGAVSIPPAAELGSPVVFTVSATDADGDVLDVLWTFGDGIQAAGADVTHVFACEGTFPVSVTVDDGFGGSAVASGNVTVTNTEEGVTALCRGATLEPLSGARTSETFYKVVVPEGVSSLTLSTTGGTGNVQLYVKEGSRPGRTNGTYDYRCAQPGNDETLTVDIPGGKTWYLLLYAASAYSEVTLTVQ
ncbi:MAG: PKD domain-containing protein [Acidobacteria bacterium]|nr:PKD domain-containing protein [Acidobacteriota bacterium]